ncbi:nonribosomal peptide synthase Pes1 [Aspergillus campestris IBT 28561]|uniref:Nonribosomal peptide synthase Pes1 n=1 Tax=Aspergillus campestris (strain IBT 28561) TaxID=1392248 RepID=A0A2I1DCG2_ASPC2|nr:nonribosomal peptide synthase Pes1 [Aspergillus campestris IBT 28561]PKY07567.1 nonribosomal peptide synthase Pes1 [Aspergillus campestris IBT 28561]
MRLRTTPERNSQLVSAWDGGNLEAIFKTAWTALLHRYTESEDICFGYQRIDAEDSLSGSLQSTGIADIPEFRLAVNEDDSLMATLKKVEAMGKPTTVRSLCRDTSACSTGYLLFNTVLMVREASSTGRAQAITLPEDCRVRVQVKVLSHDIGIVLEWWNDDMSTEQMRSIAKYFEQLLDTLISAQDATMNGALGHISEQDWARLCALNASPPRRLDQCVHEVIEAQAALRPHEQAVCAWDGDLTYRELDDLASRVASLLQARGVGPEVRVGLCFDKSKWNVVAMLAVMKAGGAFVSLDPTHPISRTQSLVQSAEAKLVLCSRNHVENLENVAEMLMPLDDSVLDASQESCGRNVRLAKVQSSNAAYIIFTSGSTGQPKGTLLEHGAFVSSAMAWAPKLHIDSHSRSLQFAAHTFDACLVEILTTLMQGGCVCVPSEEDRLNDIVEVINGMGVNFALLTPSFVEFLDPSEVPTLETLVLGGEAMSPSQLNTWSVLNLVNAYGPTEGAVVSVVNSSVTPSSDCKDIGLPVGVRAWIVHPDDHNKLVPLGCPGELLLEGPTLARCYINNAQKTNEAFIHSPDWATRDGARPSSWRFYKTGDLVRYNSDAGSLTYIGRKDTQVKFHGQRIELGEIENQLSTEVTVKHCLVLFPKSGFAQGKLVAVFTLSAESDDPDKRKVPLKLIDPSKRLEAVAELRQNLSARLPTYMVPSVWFCIEAFPFLASGKLDRKSTASWVAEMENDSEAPFFAADIETSEVVAETTTPVTDQLASIWSRVLNIPLSQVGLDKSFLSLGGDSIAALTCIGFCRKQGIGLTVQEVLRSKSIRELSTHAKEFHQATSYQEQVDEPFDLSPIQTLHYMVRQEHQGHFNQSILTRLNQTVDVRDLRRAVETLISRHSMLRARLTPANQKGDLQQMITTDIAGSYSLQTHKLARLDDTKEAIARSHSAIDASVGPLFAVDLFHISGENSYLSLVAHHLVVDIVSWRIILEDLEDLIVNPHQSESENCSLPFQTWCRLQNEQCQAPLSEGKNIEVIPALDLGYWGVKNRLLTYGDVDCETFEIDAGTANCLLVDCHQSLQTEPVDIFLAALLHSFGQTFRDRPSPVIHNEGHGREAWDATIDISRTIGWFTVLQPIMTSKYVGDDPIESVIRVKDLRRRVADHGRQDFACRMLQGKDDQKIRHHCPMEILFNYVGQHRDLQRQDGLFQLMSQMAGESGKGDPAADFGEDTPRFALFEISAMAVQGRLRFIFTFNRYMNHQGRIRDWISNCRRLLMHLGPKLLSLAPRPTLSSYSMLSLNYEELEEIVSKKLPRVGIQSPELIEDIYPCSRMQQGILLGYSRDNSLYAVNATFEVTSPATSVDVDKLARAWKQVVSYHAMLRSVFVENLTTRELFFQVVLKTFDSRPSYVRCTDDDDVLDTLNRQNTAKYAANQPPHRFTICQTATGKVFFRIELSHASMDGASIPVILNDLQSAYNGKLDNDKDHKPTFKNFIRYLEDTKRDSGIDYWCSYLSSIQPCHLPVLNDGQISEKELRTFKLSFKSCRELQKSCEKNGLTLSTVFRTAWGLTLRSFANSNDVCFGYTASLRDVPVEEIDSIVGPVVNLLACRMNVSGNTLLREALYQVQDNYMESLPYRNCSLIDIQHALKLSDTALFNTTISYRRLPSEKAERKNGIQFRETSKHDPAEFPVFVNVEVSDNDADIEMNYWTDTISDGQAMSVASTFIKSLENIIHYQDKEIGKIDALSDSDRRQVAAWNSHIPRPAGKCVQEIIQENANTNGDTLAISAGDVNLTYSKLHEMSTSLAAYLEKLGVGEGVLVPIDMEKSAWQAVTILAVFKAGGICVPMPDSQPPLFSKDWFMDNDIQVVLASPQRVQDYEGMIPNVIPIDGPLFKYLPRHHRHFQPRSLPSHDAYVILTTGGSSIAKAVVLKHNTILMRAEALASTLDLSSATRMFLFSSYTFDMFLQELFGTLVLGGCVCFPSDSDPAHLPVNINLSKANTLCLTPSVASVIDPFEITHVQKLAVYGECLPTKVRDTWSPKVRLYTFFGAAECSLTCLYDPDPDKEVSNFVSNAACGVWLVNPSNHNYLVPIGCIGEVVIEGPILSESYLFDEDNVKPGLIKDPTWSLDMESKRPGRKNTTMASSKPPRWMFKTGDLARFNSNGTLIYLGNKNEAVKMQREVVSVEQRINDFLSPNSHCAVELVEVSSRLDTTEHLTVFVLSGASIASEMDKNHQLITQPSSEFRKLGAELHTKILKMSPADQTPQFYLPVPQMPLTVSGKLDREALRDAVRNLATTGQTALETYAPSKFSQIDIDDENFEIESVEEQSIFQKTTAKTAAKSEESVEKTLRSVWEEALGLAPGSVNAEDSFFRLGGDSVTAMKIVGTLYSRGISLTVASIYKFPVLMEMADNCERLSSESDTTIAEQFDLLPTSLTRDEVLEEIADQCEVEEESIYDVYPCSAVQEGLITMSMKQRGAYLARPVFRLTEKVDLQQFQYAWQQTVNELEILRTRIVHTDSSTFVQAVLDDELIDWNFKATLEEAVDDAVNLPEHNGGRLTDYTIVSSKASRERYFIWTIHHALYDGWSMGLVLKRVEEIYSGLPAEAPVLPYKIFVKHLLDRDISESDIFWKSHLSGLSCSPFPKPKPSSSNAGRVGNKHRCSMAITRGSNPVDLSIPELIRAAWALVVATHSGSSDVCFGETLTGRNIHLSGVTNVVGPVLTTAPTRIQVENDLPIAQYLENVRQLTTSMISHQHSGLQQIRKLSGDTAIACEFQNLLAIQISGDQFHGDLWSPEDCETNEDFLTHPLVVECEVGDSQLEITAHHDEVIMNSWQTKNVMNQFCHVLKQFFSLSKSEDRSVGSIELCSPADRDQIATWNKRELFKLDRCIHDIIEERYLAQPQSPAICAWDGRLSYRELYQLAATFATYLSSRGVGPETMVPVCLDKSLWAMVTIVGILMSGGAFVPLDPSHPTSRHKEIIEEVDAQIVCCSPQHQDRYSGFMPTVIPVSKDTIKAYGSLVSGKKGRKSITPSNVAYAIFTSGSTGRPKGILIDHRAIVSSIMGFGPILNINRKTRAFHFASLTFDAAIVEIFATLMLGGCTCIPSEEERLNDVAGAIRRMNVTWSLLTPSIADIIEPSTVPTLKVLVCGGEKLSQEVVTKWAHRVKLMNAYGPTETAIVAVMDPDVSPDHDGSRIGHGIPSTLTWVVDPENHDRLTPLGAVGELAMEGPALAREYLKNPEKTAEVFVYEPAWMKHFPRSLPSPRRIYKSGDLVRYNHDGSIEYLGRKDYQVKLQGQRMELGEIERRLQSDSRIHHAVVILPKAGPLQKRLVTVLTLKSLPSSKTLSLDDTCELIDRDSFAKVAFHELVAIQKNLETQLPVYMVPQTWAVMKKLPMLVSGKLNRKRVTTWLEFADDATHKRIMADYDAIKRGNIEPSEEEDRTSTVHSLRDIFAQVLNLSSEKVDLNRSFVSMGGDSISGIGVISKARKIGLVLTLDNVLRSKSIEELARSAGAKTPVARVKEKTGEYFELSPIQRLYFQSANSYEGASRFNQSITVQINRDIKPEVVQNAVRAVIKQHAMFRARFSKGKSGQWQQRTMENAGSCYKFSVHSIDQPSERLPIIAKTQSSLNIQNGNVFAADLFKIRGGKQIIFLVANHLVVDVVSWRIVLQDLQDFIESGSLSLEKSLSFQGWCDLQKEHVKNENTQLPFSVKTPDLKYWGMDNRPNVYGQTKLENFTLGEKATKLILGGCNDVLRTETIDLLLAAVAHSFKRVFTDRRSPTIHNEGHGREPWDPSIDLSRTVGWFTTLTPLHVEGGPDILHTLKRVKDMRRKVASDNRYYFAQNFFHSKKPNFPVPVEMMFNYLGQLQQLESKSSLFSQYGDLLDVQLSEGFSDIGLNTPRFALLEVSAIVLSSKLHMSFRYNTNMRHQQKIRDWAYQCKQVFEEDILDLKDFVPEPTLSDYPLLPITYDSLNRMMKNTLPKVGIRSWDVVEDIYPCTPVQEGILLNQLRNPRGYMFSGIYEAHNLGSAGKIDSKRLRKAWAMVVARHPVLRTLFIDASYRGGSFDQVVVKDLADDVFEINSSDSTACDLLEKVDHLSMSNKRPLKVPQQLTICTSSSGRVWIKVEGSNTIIDGGSIDILLRDLALAYNNQLPAGPGPLFSDYIKHIKSRTEEETLKNWTRYLSGVRPCHLSSPSETRKDRQQRSFMIDFDRFHELHSFCEKNSITMSNITLSAWAIVLRSFTDSDDICFGYPSAGRDSSVPGIQDAVGVFINMLCCRVKFATGQSLLDISNCVQDDYIRNLPHQNCSLAQIQHEIGHQGQMLFDSVLSIQNHTFQRGSTEKGITFEYQKGHDPSEYPVTLSVDIAKSHERILLRYWTDTVSDDRARLLANAVCKVFTSFIDRPSEKVSDLVIRGELSKPSKPSQARPSSEPQNGDGLTGNTVNRELLQSLIDNRVNEIIGSMIEGGKLATPSAQNQKTTQAQGGSLVNTRSISRKQPLSTPTPTPTKDSESPSNSDINDEKLAEQQVREIALSRAASSEKISILRPTNLDNDILEAGICPKIGVFRSGIAGIFPVTDFQAFAITGSLFESRWMLNYVYMDGKGPLDLKRLRESFMRVVDSFDILRTIFVCFYGQFFQVVLKKLRPDIFVRETEKSLDEYTELLRQQDREEKSRQGQRYLQFYVVKKKKSDEHRILMRLSHAQYDGMCMGRILSAIKTAYEGSPLPPASTFSSYMRLLPGSITSEHYEYWATLLKGSRMTEVIRREKPNTFNYMGALTEQKKTIEIKASTLGNVTVATAMQAAWAMTLARLSASSDVVFGLTINGRNATVPGVDTTVGPCLNLIPVRVNFLQRWTGLDLFRYLQDQQFANMPYESLGFREIIRRCTDWPDSTFFSTTVFHQNVSLGEHMQLDDNIYDLSGAGVDDNLSDFRLASTSNQDKIDISLAYSHSGPITPTFAMKVLDMVCENAQNLINNPNATLPSPNTLRSLPSQVVSDKLQISDEQFLTAELNNRSISEILVHSEILTRIWKQVLPRKDRSTSPQFYFHSSFFELGGDIVNMGQVLWLLEQEGLHVRFEELLQHPTFLGQMGVLALNYPKELSAMIEDQRPVQQVTTADVTGIVKGVPASGPLGKAMTLARRFTKWSTVSNKG